VLEINPKPGAEWLEVVSRPTLQAFSSAFSADLILEAPVLAEPLLSVKVIYDFFRTTRSMYDHILFVHEIRSSTRACLDGKACSKVRALAVQRSYDASDAIERIRLFHFRHKQLNVINVSSILGFVPLVPTAAYSPTKAALHSYTLSQRYKLRSIGIRVIEIAPPWIRTELLNSLEEERAMPLDSFIEGTMGMLATEADEILVGQAPQMRANPGPHEHVWVNQFNDLIAPGPPLG
jgi:NAD(P)-dependent dehydrogenase (short-subunit alcohol dehydrogenase family)